MTNNITSNRKTVFESLGYKKTINNLIKQTQELYLSDEIPWVLGYSGGKDSTAILQLVWRAIEELPKDKHIKPIHVISTDTLVENPIVSLWVERSLNQMKEASDQKKLPIQPHRLTPAVRDRFWVNLIGKGYPAPRPKFRWCTSRLKISPSNDFITNMVKANGEAILILGTRKAESASRAANMKKYEQGSTRDLLSRNKELDRVWVYTPVSDWQDDDVWQYLMQDKNPWGFANEELLNMYQGATSDGECPLVVDTSTPSCGDSRFGCYVCTMVSEDKSMTAMIQNDAEKEWMLPLLELRTKWLDITDRNTEIKNKKIDNERTHRDFRRMNGSLTLHNDRLVHGPYKQEYRTQLLEALLRAEIAARELGPQEVKQLELITLEELEEIRRIWVMEKHEIEDILPTIYEKVHNKPYPGKRIEEAQVFKNEDMSLLKKICKEKAADSEGLHYELIRDLLHIEHQNRTMVRRSKLFDSLDKTLERNAFKTEAEALEFAQTRKKTRDSIDDQEEASILFNDTMNL
ncbi:MAG: DNA phosphorothioation system sulfurtransferase DndC [Cycloclasticus sp.]|nr:MAG: DNA phosphorothioation system sulfurtransferase DndC [Cycloclasticus sp.]